MPRPYILLPSWFADTLEIQLFPWLLGDSGEQEVNGPKERQNRERCWSNTPSHLTGPENFSVSGMPCPGTLGTLTFCSAQESNLFILLERTNTKSFCLYYQWTCIHLVLIWSSQNIRAVCKANSSVMTKTAVPSIFGLALFLLLNIKAKKYGLDLCAGLLMLKLYNNTSKA